MVVIGSIRAIGVGGDKGSYRTKFKASVAIIGLVGATRAGGVISFEEGATKTRVKMSSRNGGTFGSPYFFQRYIQ